MFFLQLASNDKTMFKKSPVKKKTRRWQKARFMILYIVKCGCSKKNIYVYISWSVCVCDCARKKENMRREKGREMNSQIQEEDKTNKYLKFILKSNIFLSENGNKGLVSSKHIKFDGISTGICYTRIILCLVASVVIYTYLRTLALYMYCFHL